MNTKIPKGATCSVTYNVVQDRKNGKEKRISRVEVDVTDFVPTELSILLCKMPFIMKLFSKCLTRNPKNKRKIIRRSLHEKKECTENSHFCGTLYGKSHMRNFLK